MPLPLPGVPSTPADYSVADCLVWRRAHHELRRSAGLPYDTDAMRAYVEATRAADDPNLSYLAEDLGLTPQAHHRIIARRPRFDRLANA